MALDAVPREIDRGGTALAVANALGFDAVGVDLGARKCRAARRLVVELAAHRRGDPGESPSPPTEDEERVSAGEHTAG
jgi:hypothetical protein